MFVYGGIVGAIAALIWFHYYGATFVARLQSYRVALAAAYLPASNVQGFVLLPALGALSGLSGLFQALTATATATVNGTWVFAAGALQLLGVLIQALGNPLVAFLFGAVIVGGPFGAWQGIAIGHSGKQAAIEGARREAIDKANKAVDAYILKANANAATAIANAKADYEKRLADGLKKCNKK
jgi:hypothetical protein